MNGINLINFTLQSYSWVRGGEDAFKNPIESRLLFSLGSDITIIYYLLSIAQNTVVQN